MKLMFRLQKLMTICDLYQNSCNLGVCSYLQSGLTIEKLLSVGFTSFRNSFMGTTIAEAVELVLNLPTGAMGSQCITVHRYEMKSLTIFPQ